MPNSVRELLADLIRFIAVGVVHMATINRAAVFKDVETRVSNGIPQIMAAREITSTLVDEEAYREYEENNPVGLSFLEARPDPAFHIISVQRNQLISVFDDSNATRTELQNA